MSNMTPFLRLWAIGIVALLSGSASIIYQINWQRDFIRILGASHYATTTVVFAFFFGFALGAYLARHRVDRLRNIFLGIAGLEAVVAGFAWISPWVFAVVGRLGGALAPAASDSLLAVSLIRAALATSAVILPTICMGATLPFFYRAGVAAMAQRGTQIGLITGLNALGAVFGSLVTTFYLMGTIPGAWQLRIASVLNVVAASIAFALSRRVAASIGDMPEASHELPTGRQDWRVLAAYTLSGAAGLSLEIVWNRMAYMSLQHTIYSFALTLSVYLAAYSVGTLVGGIWMRRSAPARSSIGVLHALAMLATLGGFIAFRSGLDYRDLQDSMGYFGAATSVVSVYVFLPTFFMGVAMPIVLQRVSSHFAALGRDTSMAQMLNNIGSLVSVLIVGFVLIPLTNLRVVAAFCLLQLLVSSLLLIELPFSRERRVWVSIAVVAVAIVLLGLYPNPIAFREDASGFWSVTRARERLVLTLDGYYENRVDDPPRDTVEGDFLIPAMLEPEIGSVYMVGLGLGIGAYELLRFDDTKHFKAAEFSSASLELAREVWDEFGGGFFEDPRFEVVYEDGRIWLDQTTDRFDVIMAGTNRSFYPGSTMIYSRDFWQIAKGKLRPGGMLFQWLPTSSRASAGSLLKTFLEVFPDAILIRYDIYLYMIGYRDGRPVDLEDRVRTAFARGREQFSTSKFKTPEELLQRVYLPDREALADFPTNRDDLPVVEYGFRGFEYTKSPGSNFPLRLYARPYIAR